MKSDRRRRYHRGRNRKKNHIGILIAAVAVIIAGTAGATLAYLSHQSGLTNQFQIAKVSTEIKETFDGGDTKENVSVKNTGDVPAYIRAAVIIGWQDEEGNALIDEAAPEVNKDYTIDLNLETGSDGQWIQGSDGYYYYTSPVEGGQATEKLIDKCVDKHGKDGKYLVVDIAAQSIQATPAAAVKEAWGPDKGAVTGVVTDDGILEIQEAQAGGGA